jgi:hypothetical protein
MITLTIENRAIELIAKGIDALDAVKIAIIEENKLIEELIEQKTNRAINAKNQMLKNTYALIHLQNAINN